MAQFINAQASHELTFVRGTTEGINLIAQTWGRQNLKAGDTLLLTRMEHHANIVPWQLLAEEKGFNIEVVPVNPAGELEMDAFETLLKEHPVKLVALTHVSNALGTINPVKDIIKKAHAAGALVLLDGAQAIPHFRVDVQDLDCDFYAFSGHKLFGPTGIGCIWAREEIWKPLPPYQGGGAMIQRVSFEGTTYQDAPVRYEAGTPHIAGALGMMAVVDYLTQWDASSLEAHEHKLLEYATAKLQEVPTLKIIGTAKEKVSVISFVMDAAHPHDLATILNEEGVAIRAGHHCCMPLMRHFGVAGTARASFAFYNTEAEVDRLVTGLHKAKDLFNV